MTLGKSLPGNCNKLGHLFAWAFLSIIFLIYQLKLIWYFFPSESKLLLRSELPVVALGKSLPGNCSKLGHLFAWAFLSIIFLTYQLKLIYIFFHVRANYYWEVELPVVTLGKSLPGNCSKLGHLFAWAFLAIIFVTYQLKLILYLFPSESKLLLRSELSVVTLGKSLPGNCSKLGHLFAWAFLSIIFLTYQLKLVLYLFPFESKLWMRSELSVVSLGKSLPGNWSKMGHLFAWDFWSIIFVTYQLKLILYLFLLRVNYYWEVSCPLWPCANLYVEASGNWGIVCLGFFVNNFSYIPTETIFVPFSISE